MKNKYSEIRLVESVMDVRNLVRSKSLIMVAGWKKPVSASFIGVMPESTIDKYINEHSMYLVAKEPVAGRLVKGSGKENTIAKIGERSKPSLLQRIINWWKS